MIVGILFLLFGLSILLRIFFKINFPVMRTFGALFLIYLGVRMLFGTFGWHAWGTWKTEDSVVFGHQNFVTTSGSTGRNEYNTVFGKSTVDLTQLPKTGESRVVINTVFGETRVIIDPSMPIRISANAVFGQATLPDRSTVAFGSLKWRSPSAQAAQENDVKTIRVKGDVVFGNLQFVTKDQIPGGKSQGGDDDESDDD
ncbi:MAG: LiaF domain-containing protein [Bdellovibrionota bacterium]